MIAADVRLYREGLAQILGGSERISIVGTAADWTQCLVRARELEPDVVLLDMAMPESLTAVRSIGIASPGVRVVAIGVSEVCEHIILYAEAGVAGYVTRDASLEQLVETIESAARGECVLSPRMAATGVKVVAVSESGRQGLLYELRPHRVPLGDLSSGVLVEVIRRARDQSSRARVSRRARRPGSNGRRR